MGRPAAKQDDQVVGVDIHILMVTVGPVVTPTPVPHPFTGQLTGALSSDVKIMGKPAAVLGSTADNTPAHIPTIPTGQFQKPPTNKATVMTGSATVLINGKPAARTGDTAMTCNDPADLANGKIVAFGTVMIG
jgi:uncharacterized Zn-binding protein involved in type VI secretion